MALIEKFKLEIIDLIKERYPDLFCQKIQTDIAEIKRLLRKVKEEKVTDFFYNPAYPVSTVWDLGYSDDTVIVFYQVIAGQYRVIDHYKTNNHDLVYYANYVKSKLYKYDRHWLPVDAHVKSLYLSGISAIDVLKKNGIKSISIFQ